MATWQSFPPPFSLFRTMSGSLEKKAIKRKVFQPLFIFVTVFCGFFVLSWNVKTRQRKQEEVLANGVLGKLLIHLFKKKKKFLAFQGGGVIKCKLFLNCLYTCSVFSCRNSQPITQVDQSFFVFFFHSYRKIYHLWLRVLLTQASTMSASSEDRKDVMVSNFPLLFCKGNPATVESMSAVSYTNYLIFQSTIYNFILILHRRICNTLLHFC